MPKSNLNKRKIMMFSSVHPYKDARILYKETKSLAKYYQIDLYAIGDGAITNKEENIYIHPLKRRSRLTRVLTIIQLKKQIKKSEAKFYHFHDPELLFLVKFIRKNKVGAIIIYDMHENFPKAILSKNWIPKFMRKKVSVLAQIVEKKILLKVDGVIFAEQSYKKYYPEILDKAIDIYNYPLFINKREKNRNGKCLNLIYIGRIAKIRGVFTILEVITQIKKESNMDIKLTLIGSVDAKLFKEINDYINRNNIADSVKYKDYIAYTKIWDYYSSADIGICLLHPVPNYLESLATKMFEYMAAGLPMIVSNFPTWEVLVENNKCGFAVSPFNVDTIKSKIYQLRDNKLRNDMGNAGRKAYEHKYNWSLEDKKLIDFYSYLLDSSEVRDEN